MAFLPGENKKIDTAQARDVSFDMMDFVEQVFNDEYALIIGSEVLLNPERVPLGGGDINRYLISVINELQHTECADFNELIENAGHNVDPIRNLLTDNAFLSEMSLEDLAPELVRMLNLRLFKIVITTTPDSYLEMLMRSIWGERLRIVNVADDRSLNEFRNLVKNYRGQAVYNEPTLIYAFGKAEKNEALRFARTDADYIYFVERWMKFDSHSNDFMDFVKSRKILSLGCKFEDWYFRFFWYVLRRDVDKMGNGQVAIQLDINDRADANLDDFFRRYRVYNHSRGGNQSSMDARRFMSFITDTLTSVDESSPFRQQVIARRRKQGIFISYYHTDEVIATKLFFMLSRKFPNVWFDTQRLKIGDYNSEITSAIVESKVFIPVLSPAVAKHLVEGDDSHYYRTEWAIASQVTGNDTADKENGTYILPLAVNGYDLFANEYHRDKFEAITGFHNTGVNLMSPSGFSQLVERIDSILNR